MLFRFLGDEYQRVHREAMTVKYQKIAGSKAIPQQNNGTDCGIYTCLNANLLSQDLPLEVRRRDVQRMKGQEENASHV